MRQPAELWSARKHTEKALKSLWRLTPISRELFPGNIHLHRAIASLELAAQYMANMRTTERSQ